jgi:hypothetical protein
MVSPKKDLGIGGIFLHDRMFTFLFCIMNICLLTQMLYFCYSTLTTEWCFRGSKPISYENLLLTEDLEMLYNQEAISLE